MMDYNPPAINTTKPSTPASTNTALVNSTTSSDSWVKYVEELYYYAGVVTTQASTNGACSNDSRYRQHPH